MLTAPSPRIAVTLLLVLSLAGCVKGTHDDRNCHWQHDDAPNDGRPPWLKICETTLEFRSDESAIVVASVGPDDDLTWGRYDLISPPGAEVRVAFNRPATSNDSKAPIDLDEVATGRLEPGQYLGLCGPQPSMVALSKNNWPGSVSGPVMDLAPCA